MTELDVSKMTPEQRLRQIELLLSTAAKGMNRNTESIQTINLQLEQLSGLIIDATRLMAQQQAKTERREERYQQSQAEIERIWQYLNSRSGNGNSPQ